MGPTTLSARSRRATLGVLVGIYTLNMMDRQILAILVEPIKRDLSLTDTQLGLLTGIAFALFYATLGVPIARIADRRDRVTIISIALATWSVMTAACGLAQGFVHMALARVGVGVGEAGCTPAAHSMITDLFPIERRASALSVYQLGAPLGMVFGFLIGGWVNELWGWRAAFFVVGLPGVGMALLVRFMLRDPTRAGRPIAAAPGAPGFRQAFARLWRIPSFRHICIAFSLAAFAQSAFAVWAPAFYMRTHELSSAEVGSLLGPLSLLGGGVGTLLGGVLTDRFGRRDRRYYVWIPAAGMILASPFIPVVVLTGSVAWAMGLAVAPTLLTVMFMGPSFAMVQSLSPVQLRAMASAIVLLLANLIGMGLGPLSVGVLSDALEPRLGDASLRYALMIAIVANLWAAAHFFWSGRTLRADLEHASGDSDTSAAAP